MRLNKKSLIGQGILSLTIFKNNFDHEKHEVKVILNFYTFKFERKSKNKMRVSPPPPPHTIGWVL